MPGKAAWYSTARVSKRLCSGSTACLRARYCTGVLGQGVLDVLKTISDFDHGVFALVFVLDIGGDVILLLFQELEDLFDRRIALPPGSVRPILLLAVFQVQVGDAGVIGFNI